MVMKKFIFRLFAVLVLLCGAMAPGQGILAQGNIQRHQGENATVARFDGAQGGMMEQNERPASPVVRTAGASHRVGANRPSRLIPSHGGGKTGRGDFALLNRNSCHFIKYACLFLHRGLAWAAPEGGSPRYYFVIALRRFLC